jgi:hypothetical protein
MERVNGVEPSYPAWKAGALAVVLHPQKNKSQTQNDKSQIDWEFGASNLEIAGKWW